MEENSNLNQKAKTIPYEERKNIILSFTELEIQKFLKNLYQSIEPDYLIEVTQGTREFGKDLVLVRKDRISQHVIGVIVKLGNIRGKSLGDVDLINNRIGQTVTEKVILSQINQAAKNPAELKSSLEDLRINEIKVVIVGEVSNEARTRLRNEIENINIEIYDLHWVIESFTEYYPQIFYGGNLLSFFENEIQNLETNHWLTKKGYNLSEVFVNPMVSTVIVDSYDKLNEFSSNLIEKKKLPFEELKELIFSGEKILLIGEAGTGKTGVLTKIIIDFYNEKVIEMIKNPLLDRKCKIPVFIKCSDYTNKNIDLDSLLQFIPSDIRNNFEIASIMSLLRNRKKLYKFYWNQK